MQAILIAVSVVGTIPGLFLVDSWGRRKVSYGYLREGSCSNCKTSLDPLSWRRAASTLCPHRKQIITFFMINVFIDAFSLDRTGRTLPSRSAWHSSKRTYKHEQSGRKCHHCVRSPSAIFLLLVLEFREFHSLLSIEV